MVEAPKLFRIISEHDKAIADVSFALSARASVSWSFSTTQRCAGKPLGTSQKTTHNPIQVALGTSIASLTSLASIQFTWLIHNELG